MLSLTPLGKIFFAVIGIIIIVAVVLFVFPGSIPAIPSFSGIFPGSPAGGIPLIKVFVTSYGADSVDAVGMLREVSRSDEFRGKFDYQIIQVDVAPEQASQFNVTKIPSFIIGKDLVEGPVTRIAFEEKLRPLVKN